MERFTTTVPKHREIRQAHFQLQKSVKKALQNQPSLIQTVTLAGRLQRTIDLGIYPKPVRHN